MRTGLSARAFLVRGLLAGVVAGVVAFGVAYAVGEPPLNAAIAYEGEEAGTVPRSLQATAGLLTGTLLAGVTLGGLLGVLVALALGRSGRWGIRGLTLALAGLGFLTFYLVPSLAYPAVPPGVGQAGTIGLRNALYGVALAVSVVATVTSVLVGRRLAARWGGWYAGLAAAGGYLVVVVVALVLLPTVDEVPADYPATLLYEFRAAAVATQVALWSVLGVVLAELLHRVTRPVGSAAEAGTVATAPAR